MKTLSRQPEFNTASDATRISGLRVRAGYWYVTQLGHVPNDVPKPIVNNPMQ